MRKRYIPKIRFNSFRSHKSGLPPGSLIFTGKQKVEQPVIQFFSYNETEFLEKPFTIETRYEKDPDRVQWLDVRGLHDIDLISHIGRLFNIHPLALEDILDVNQRPKLDEYETGFYIVIVDFRFNLIFDE